MAGLTVEKGITAAIEKKMRLHSKGLKISPEVKSQIAREGYWLGFPVFWLEEGINVAILDGDGRYARCGSPYELRRVEEGRYAIFEGEELFSRVQLYKRPRFVDEGSGARIKAPEAAFAPTFEPYVQLICYNHLQIWSSITCIYFKTGNPCGFCCLSAVSDWGEEKFFGKDPAWIRGVCEGIETACQELGPGIESTGLFISCGTWPSADKGAEVHVNILNAIRERLGGRLPFKHITTDVEPPISDESLYRLAEAGLTNVLFDLEVYDEETRRQVMPNAKGFRKVSDYDRAFEKALEIFGHNEGCLHPKVSTILVAGLERDETLLKGVEHLAQLGIPPAIAPYYPATDSPLEKAGVPAPSAERMREIYLGAAEILEKYHLFPESFGVCGLAEVMGVREPMVEYYR